MNNLLQQLPSRRLQWSQYPLGGQNNDSRGELIETFITKNDICIMNDKSYTYHSPSTKSYTYHSPSTKSFTSVNMNKHLFNTRGPEGPEALT